jgi:hypothetical protein
MVSLATLLVVVCVPAFGSVVLMLSLAAQVHLVGKMPEVIPRDQQERDGQMQQPLSLLSSSRRQATGSVIFEAVPGEPKQMPDRYWHWC